MATISRYEMNIPADKRAKYEAAAKDAKISLSAWMQQAADSQLNELSGELLIEALEAVLDEYGIGDHVSDRTMNLIRTALKSVGRL